jgi:hypothetical protein
MSERAALKFPQLGLIPTPRHPASAANFLNTIPGARPLTTNPPAAPALPITPPATTAPEQVIVVTDTGLVYRGTSAWIMCLWALKRYRAWSVLLATPPWRPRVARIIDGLGRRRLMISRLLMLEAQADARAQSPGDPDCPDGACHVTR